MPCVGDCDGGGEVTVDELVRAVNYALDDGAPVDCHAVDANDDGRVSVDELVRAVIAALTGCAA